MTPALTRPSKDVTGAGGRALAVPADVADEHAVTRLFDTAEESFGGVDVVVSSAGRMRLATVAELDLDELDALHRTNIRGTFVVSQQAARRLRRGGALVTLSSSVVGLQFPRYAAYAASKGAVEAMTLILARELRGRRGRVPGQPGRPLGQRPGAPGQRRDHLTRPGRPWPTGPL
jgi:3-oxoacyl-[acyl-carrier protein] reductase